jgi:hypothetical protein
MNRNIAILIAIVIIRIIPYKKWEPDIVLSMEM